MAITVAAILMAIADPSFLYITNSNRVSADVNGLLGDLQFARAEAFKEGQPVTVCVSSNGTTCLGNSNAWQSGWIVFSDPNGNATVDPGEGILRVQKSLKSTDSFAATNAVTAVSFNREGFAQFAPAAANTLLQLHVTGSQTNNNWTRCLSITFLGLMGTQQYNQPSTISGVNCT